MEKQTGRSQKKEKDGGWKRRRRRGRREGEERKKKSWEEKKRTEKIPRMSSDFPAKPLWGGWRDLPGSSTLYCRTVCFYRTTLQKIPCSPSLISLSHSPHSLSFYPVFHLHSLHGWRSCLLSPCLIASGINLERSAPPPTSRIQSPLCIVLQYNTVRSPPSSSARAVTCWSYGLYQSIFEIALIPECQGW